MKIINKNATFNYQVKDPFEAGVKLLGAEVKAIRGGHVDLGNSYVRIKNGEAYLINARIFPYSFARPEAYDETRSRKLLLHKKELISLKSKLDGEKLTVVPLSMYTSHGLIKIELALAKSKKKFDKKESIKRKDINRHIEQELKRHS